MKTKATRYFECGSAGGSVEYWNNMHIYLFAQLYIHKEKRNEFNNFYYLIN